MVMQREPQSKYSRRRVFCFGDSITKGVIASTSTFSPYGIHLQKALRTYPGLESILVQTLYFQSFQSFPIEAGDFTHILDKIGQTREPLLIILTGMNDLTTKGATCNGITEAIIRLHTNAHKRGIKTVAVGLPPSLLQEERQSIKILAGDVNRCLRAWAQGSSPTKSKVTFVPFPIRSFDRGDKLWASDGFHLSKEGYEFIGSNLASHVSEALKRIT